MAWSGNRGSASKSTTSVRLTGLFASKNKRGLYVGGIKADQLDGVIKLLKEAYTQKKGVAFFLWRQQQEEDRGPAFALSADLDRDQGQRSGGSYEKKPTRRPIEKDDNDVFGAKSSDDDEGGFPWKD